MPRCSCPSLEMLMLMLEQMTDQAGDQAQGCHAIDLREPKAAMRSLVYRYKVLWIKVLWQRYCG